MNLRDLAAGAATWLIVAVIGVVCLGMGLIIYAVTDDFATAHAADIRSAVLGGMLGLAIYVLFEIRDLLKRIAQRLEVRPPER